MKKTKQQWLDELNGEITAELIKHIQSNTYEFNRIRLMEFISNMLDEVMNDVPEEKRLSNGLTVRYTDVIKFKKYFLKESNGQPN